MLKTNNRSSRLPNCNKSQSVIQKLSDIKDGTVGGAEADAVLLWSCCFGRVVLVVLFWSAGLYACLHNNF